MPVLIAAVVLTHVHGGGSAGSARATGTAPSAVPVAIPPLTPEAQAACPALMNALPAELDGGRDRRTRPSFPFAHAWGDPAVTLVCGAGRPKGFVVGAALVQVDAVQWFVDTSTPQKVVWTAVDRPVYVQVALPAGSDSGPVAELAPVIAAHLPARDPQPAP